MTGKIKYLLAATLALCSVSLAAQTTIESLREQIQRAEREIRINTELLEKTRKDQQLSQSQLKLIQSRIRSRREVVSSLERQLDLLNTDISNKSNTVGELNAEREEIRAEYAEMVRAAYKNYKLNNFLLFLFASEDFNDATRHIAFMRRYNRMREEQAGRITALSDSISVELQSLESRKQELDQTRLSRSTELNSLARDETQYRTSVNELRATESKLDKEVKAKRAVIDRAQQQIQQIIAEENRKDNEEVRTADQDRYITELSGRFDDNRGRLPYPVRDGVIIDHYGKHDHPTQQGLKITNRGVNIAGARRSEVIAVFEGEVTKVFSLPGFNNCVMIKHGNYITLYANMAEVAVRTGQTVTPGQQVGRIADSPDNDDNFLHFEIWEQTTNLNPELWLRR